MHAMGNHHHRLFLLLCSIWLLSILDPSVSSSSSQSFNIHFSHWGYDPQEVLFHSTSPKNRSFDGSPGMYTGHKVKVVLRRKKKKNFVPKTCDCSRFDGLMYGRPVLLRDDDDDDKVASFKTTLCVRMDRQAAAAGAGLFMFLVPYPWNRDGERIEVGLDGGCTTTAMDDRSGLGSDTVVCAHVHYDGAEELLKTNVRVGDRSCLCVRKIDRSRMPTEAAVGFASVTAGDPVKLESVLTWTFHSTLESNSKEPPPAMRPDLVTTDARVRLDPWNRNVQLNLRYQRDWQQLRCSVSVTLGCGNPNADMD